MAGVATPTFGAGCPEVMAEPRRCSGTVPGAGCAERLERRPVEASASSRARVLSSFNSSGLSISPMQGGPCQARRSALSRHRVSASAGSKSPLVTTAPNDLAVSTGRRAPLKAR